MYNNAWLERGWTIKVVFHTKGDHSAFKAQLFNLIQQFRRTFKYCNFWNDNPNFQDLLEHNWSTPITNAHGQKLLVRKLSWLRVDQKSFKTRDFINISICVAASRENLKHVQAQVDKEPLNLDLWM